MKKKITVENEQKLTERLTNALAREDYDTARRRLNDIRKQARNRMDYLRRKSEKSYNLPEFEQKILAKELKEAEQNFKNVAKDVKIVRKNLNNPRNIQNAIQRLNYNVAKAENRKAVIREEMKRTGRVGVEYHTPRRSGEWSMLWYRFFYNKSASGFSESDYNFIENAFLPLGFDVKAEINKQLDEARSIGLEMDSGVLFDIEVDVLKEAINVYTYTDSIDLSPTEVETINKAIDMIRDVIGI